MVAVVGWNPDWLAHAAVERLERELVQLDASFEIETVNRFATLADRFATVGFHQTLVAPSALVVARFARIVEVVVRLGEAAERLPRPVHQEVAAQAIRGHSLRRQSLGLPLHATNLRLHVRFG